MKRLDLWDALAFGGVILVACGLWFVYAPLTPIALGASMLGISFLGAKRWDS